MATVYTNLNRAFIESDNLIEIKHLPNPEHRFKENLRLVKNIFLKNNFFININPGYNNIFNNKKTIYTSKNEIIYKDNPSNVNNYYFNDDTESDGSKRISREVRQNIIKNFGLETVDNEEYITRIFNDNTIKKQNVTNENSNTLVSTLLDTDESFFAINNSVLFLNNSIDVIGSIEKITRKNIFETETKGINADIVTHGSDLRKRNNNISSRIQIVDNKKIENYLDNSSSEHVFDANIRYQNFAYEETTVNGRSIYLANFSNTTAINEISANDLIYLSNDENDIFPYFDHDYSLNNNTLLNNNYRYTVSGELDNHYKSNQNSYNMKSYNEDYIDGYLYASLGNDIDYSQSVGVDSISYIGVLN